MLPEDATPVANAAIVSGTVAVAETVKDFVNRLFDGEALPLFEHFISEQGLSSHEIQKLRELLDRKEEAQDEPNAE